MAPTMGITSLCTPRLANARSVARLATQIVPYPHVHYSNVVFNSSGEFPRIQRSSDACAGM